MKTIIPLGFGEEISVCWVKYKLSEGGKKNKKNKTNCQTVSFEQMYFVSLQIAVHSITHGV